ncbi:hypothetical protein FRC03_002683 [Tulasnella sp. 419]|nr:hypothetical protein FRC03_002683 [Tulasnella sp. 419]
MTTMISQVEQTLFRTQELVLRRFRGLAGLLRGKDPNEVHILEGVTESEMAATLDILEARWFQGSPDFNFNQWKGALWVATLWNFEMLRDLSIRKIEDMKPPPLEILPLAKKCNVTRLFSMAYIDLCMRSTPITAEEGELLGYRRFADLVSIRESRKRQPCSECRNWSISITCVSCVESARETVGVAIMKLPVTPAVGITE